MPALPEPHTTTAPGEPIRYVVKQLTERAAQAGDMDLGGLAIALGAIANDVDAREIKHSRAERDLRLELQLLNSGRPTNWAYQQACKALEKHRTRADEAEAAMAAVRAAAIREAAQVAASKVRADHLGNGCGPCDMASVIASDLHQLATAPATTTTPEEH